MTIQKLLQFITHHWILCAAFIISFMAIIVMETRAKGSGSTRLSIQQLVQLINHEGAAIIDIRDKAAFQDGHIANAINIFFTDITDNINNINKIDKNKPIVIICANGQKSLTAINLFRQQGFVKVFLLTGGMTAWRNANMPVIK